MTGRWPQSLFWRAAALIAVSLVLFSGIVALWTTVISDTPVVVLAVSTMTALLVLGGAALFARRQAALDAQRELMLAGLSHDLRSPLARLRVAVELLDARGASLSGQMAVEIEEIDRMIGQLMHFVRAGYREMPVAACPDDIVRESAQRYAVGAMRLELNAAQSNMLPVESIRHVLLNLIQNAFEYGQAPVTVRTSLSAGELRISVADRGEGLSESEWQEAIRPFRRLGPLQSGHTGLGLAMVERLVRASRGTLAARRVDGGFEVSVTLAVRAATQNSARTEATQRRGVPGMTVCVPLSDSK